jgi:hypothetical protein
MDSINTRRWPRYQVRLPVFIGANTDATRIVVPGVVCKLSRSGLELHGQVNQQPGDLIEVEFQTSNKIRVAGVIRYRSGFCFGLEVRAVRTEPAVTPDLLESLLQQRHESYLREMQRRINRSMRIALEARKLRQEIELFANTSYPI